MTGPVVIERIGQVAIVRFNRGGRANAMDFAAMDALSAAARNFEEDHDVAAVILMGTNRIFSAGMDLREPAFARLADMPLAELRQLADKGPRMARAWAAIEAPTIAAIEGPCLAGGFALAAMCDFRVCGEGARFGAPEVAVGLNMGWHSVPRLVGLIGVQTTRRMLLLGEECSAEEAEGIGFVDRVTSDGGAHDAALDLAVTLAGRPGAAVRMVKRQIEAAAHGLDWTASALDRDQHALGWRGEDFRRTLEAYAKRADGGA